MRHIKTIVLSFVFAILFSFPVFAADSPSVSLTSGDASFSVDYNTARGDGYGALSPTKALNGVVLSGSGFDSSHLYSLSFSLSVTMNPSVDSVYFAPLQLNFGALGSGNVSLSSNVSYDNELFSSRNVVLSTFVYGTYSFSNVLRVSPNLLFSEPTTVSFSPSFSFVGSPVIKDLGLVADNQTLLDAYNSGYSAGQLVGYDTGYTAGSDAVRAEVEKNGYDSTEYPKLVKKRSNNGIFFNPSGQFGGVNSTFDLVQLESISFLYDFNPSHAYRIDVSLNFDSSNFGASDSACKYGSVDLRIFSGDSNLVCQPAENFVSGVFYSGYALGSSLGSMLNLSCTVHGVGVTKAGFYVISVPFDKLVFEIYDLGSADGSQNQIANQTESIVNGYDSSSGSLSQSKLDSSLSESDTKAASLFSSASANLDSFQLYDVSAMVAGAVGGLSFISTAMTSIYEALGGISGAGAVLALACSLMFICFVVGVYKFWKGGGD